MGHKPAITIVVFCILIVLPLLIANPAYPVSADSQVTIWPSMNGEIQQDELTGAIRAVLSQRRVVGDQYWDIYSTKVENDWAFAIVVLRSNRTRLIVSFESDYVVAHKESMIWKAAGVETPNLFNQILSSIPESLISARTKSMLATPVNLHKAQLTASSVSGYRLPWVKDITATVTNNMYGHGYNAIDFDIVDGNTSGDVLAAKDGTVVFAKDIVTQPGCLGCDWTLANLVVLRHSNSEYSWYLHLAPNSIPYSVQEWTFVPRGTKIGEEGTTGDSSGVHLHFHVTSSYSCPNCSDKTDQYRMPAWPSDFLPVDFDEYTWSTLQNTSTPRSQNSAPDTSRLTEIKSSFNGKCADVKNESRDNGAVLQQWDCWGGINQVWDLKLVRLNSFFFFPQDYYQIISRISGKCLEVQGWSRLDQGQVGQWDCVGTNKNQLWRIENVGATSNKRIINSNSGKCLDISGASQQNGALLWQNRCTGTTTQVWTLPGRLLPPSNYIDSVLVLPGKTYAMQVTVAPGRSYAKSLSTWLGSDVVTTLKTPSGRVIDRNTLAPDVTHGLSPTAEMYAIQNPEAGTWQVSFFGANVPPDGEQTFFDLITGTTEPLPQLAYVENGTLVLNMGSITRRQARNIQSDEINEQFVVKQLSASLPGTFSVTAFGLTQTFSGVTKIFADADDGNDVISLEAGSVPFTAPAELYGGSGDDRIQGGGGADKLFGGPGNDKINGGGGDDLINGDEGNDELNGEDGADSINGGPGNDIITGGAGDDTLHGDDGDDRISGDAGADKIYGDAGKDTLYGGDGDDTMYGGTDDDYMEGNAGADKMYGGAGNDKMFGNAGNDEMYGGDGDDVMDGGDGEDYMEGNAGADKMHGGNGNDKMYGNAGNDEMFGDAGNDTMYGGDGDDVMDGGDGEDYMEGNEGADKMHGGAGNDKMLGNTGPDEMYGDDGNDIMYGNAGNDVMHGGPGDDYMEGNEGSDTMYGDEGQDDMIGGTPVAGTPDGSDTMSGGPGHDVMVGDNASIVRPLVGGKWVIDSFSPSAANIVRRTVKLFDVATITSAAPPGTSGGDKIFGDDGRDIMYGQGGDDEMHGGAGDDYMEGNAGSDLMYGDDGDDDMLGGSGPTTSDDLATAVAGRIDASTRTRTVPLGANPAAIVPLGDTMYGGNGSDVMLGDNGIITRRLDKNGVWITLNYALLAATDGSKAPRHTTSGTGSRIDRTVQMLELTPGATAGSDLMYGGAGDDDMYGQLDDTAGAKQPAIGDEMYGEDGEDAMVGDLGIIRSWVIPTDTQTIRPPEPFFDDQIMVRGTLFRQITLVKPEIGGDDRMSGGAGGDWMHGGAGNDLMNGNAGNDRVFGDDGNDVLWGGPDHDHLWGGSGNDSLDIKPRTAMTIGNGKNGQGKQTSIPADPLEWFAFGQTDNFQNIDYIYGGWGQDAMQANVGNTGPVPGDRLIDWVGGYNAYYLCPGLYGERMITRNHSPNIIQFLQNLAAGDGAVDPAVRGSSGFGEIAIVFSEDINQNANPPHPDNPGHFTCTAP